ncbi:MAG: DedA family protein, partial [Anaerolineae bacterium]|nr:DedA family protein [Anaerolineae bacterium]
MAEILDQLRIIIEQIILSLGYPGISIVMFSENIFPPIPSELVMPFAGFLVAREELNFVAALVAGTLGAVVGAVVLYYIGLWADEPVV